MTKQSAFKGSLTPSTNTQVTVQNIIPPQVNQILVNQFASVGLKFDPSKIDLSKDQRGNLKQLRETVELIHNNSKLLPEFAKLLKKAMIAAQKYGKFQAEIVTEGLKSQLNIDKSHAEILLAFAGYVKEKNLVQAKLEAKLKKLGKQEEAASRFYEGSWGAQAQMIDAKWDLIMETKQKTIKASKHKQEFEAKQRDKSREWLKQAYE